MADEHPRRRLAAIVMADVVGYSRLIEADETSTLAALKERRRRSWSRLFAAAAGGSSRFWVTGC